MNGDVAITGLAYHTAISRAPDVIPVTDPASLDFATQIPNRSDLRCQGPSQLLASYTAGRALDMAGLKGNAERLAHADVMVATHFGERDLEIDGAVLEAAGSESSDGRLVNKGLMNLRPSLLLAQLPNLFAANISIVFGVLGTSITFMRETPSGVRALDEARQRILSGRSDIVLVGGVFNGTRPDILEVHGARRAEPGTEQVNPGLPGQLELGYGSAFLVLESTSAVAERNGKVRAYLGDVTYVPLGRASPNGLNSRTDQPLVTYSDVTGPPAHVAGVQRFLTQLSPDLRLHNLAAITGSLMEASFPFSAAVAADCVYHGLAMPDAQTAEDALPLTDADSIDRILVCSTGPGTDVAIAFINRRSA